jgi:hypothetical protein
VVPSGSDAIETSPQQIVSTSRRNWRSPIVAAALGIAALCVVLAIRTTREPREPARSAAPLGAATSTVEPAAATLAPDPVVEPPSAETPKVVAPASKSIQPAASQSRPKRRNDERAKRPEYDPFSGLPLPTKP